MCIRHCSLTFCCRFPQLFPTTTGFPPINIFSCVVWSMIKLYLKMFICGGTINFKFSPSSVPSNQDFMIKTSNQIAMCNVKVDFRNDGPTLTHRSWFWLYSTSIIRQLFSVQMLLSNKQKTVRDWLVNMDTALWN